MKDQASREKHGHWWWRWWGGDVEGSRPAEVTVSDRQVTVHDSPGVSVCAHYTRATSNSHTHTGAGARIHSQ